VGSLSECPAPFLPGTDARAEIPWHAVIVKHQFESSVAGHMADHGFESFLPRYNSKRQWSDRVKDIAVPLFPGYVFCRFEKSSRHRVDRIPGVRGLVGFGRELAVVDGLELDSIKAVVGAGMLVQPWPFLDVGRRVSIERGPLKGLSGIVERTKGTFRLVLSVSLLNRSVAVEIEREWVLPLAG